MSRSHRRLTLAAFLALVALGTAYYRHERESDSLRRAARYVATRPDLPDPIREDILAGRIVTGMYPDEAVAAGGSFAYHVIPAASLQWGTKNLYGRANLRLYYRAIKRKSQPPDIPPDII